MRRNHVIAALVSVCAVVLSVSLMLAQSSSSASFPAWLSAAWQNALQVPVLTNILSGRVPAVLPQTTTTLDAYGETSTYFPAGPVPTDGNPFFTPLGTNGRTCFSCHQPQDNWSITPSTIQATYLATQGQDPVFAPVDGSNCPNLGAAANSFGSQFVQARSQLFNFGNFRIFLPPPANPQWATVFVSNDPTGCELSSEYGINNVSNPLFSFYRRPLPATNVVYLTPGGRGPVPNIMWDTREPSLASQFIDATLTHAQARTAPSLTVANQGVAFQSGSFTAQSFDSLAGDLTGADGSGATGGPQNLYNYSSTVPFTGFPFALFEGGCLTNAKPCPGSVVPQAGPLGLNLVEGDVFNAFAAGSAQRASIYRGEVIFNSRPFAINGVTGLNDLFGANPLTASCAFCHNNGNVGNDLFNDPKHIGVADNSYLSAAQSSANGSSTLPLTPDRPVFNFLCPVGSITYFSNPVTITLRSSLYNGVTGTFDLYQTSDPGVGWITGKCSDLGKFKVSSLRGIGARAPFFHGGQAATMRDVVLFYNNRFSIGLSEQDIEDLTNYLNAQ